MSRESSYTVLILWIRSPSPQTSDIIIAGDGGALTVGNGWEDSFVAGEVSDVANGTRGCKVGEPGFRYVVGWGYELWLRDVP